MARVPTPRDPGGRSWSCHLQTERCRPESEPSLSLGQRQLEKLPRHLTTLLVQLRIELFLCAFKIKHIRKERRQCEIGLPGVTPHQITGVLRPGRQEGLESDKRKGVRAQTSAHAGCGPGGGLPSLCLTQLSRLQNGPETVLTGD